MCRNSSGEVRPFPSRPPWLCSADMNNSLVTVFGGTGLSWAAIRCARWRAPAIASASPCAIPTTVSSCRRWASRANRPRQMQCARMRIRSPLPCMARSVVNLTGILYQRGEQSFEAVHVEAAEAIAKAARAAGVTSLVHVSAIGADTDAESRYAASKGEGEVARARSIPRRGHPAAVARVRAGGRFLQPLCRARALCFRSCR